MTSSKDPTDDSENPANDPEGSEVPANDSEGSESATEESPPRARTPSEIEELQRNPSIGAIRVGEGLSVEHDDLIERAAYGSREKSSLSDGE